MQIAEDGDSRSGLPVPSSKSGGSAGPRAPFVRLFGRRIADLGKLSLSWASSFRVWSSKATERLSLPITTSRPAGAIEG